MTSDHPPAVAPVVEVRVPSDVAYVSTLRLTAASLAARCELTVDDIEDLRLAVDEACALLLPLARPATAVDARFVLAPDRLDVHISVQAPTDAEPDRSGFAWTVLGALASAVDVRRAADVLTVTVTKTRAAAAR